MRKNACGLDRLARIVVGIALLGLAVGTSRDVGEIAGAEVSPWQILAAYAGGELLVTGLLQWCPANHTLGIDTCANERSRVAALADRARHVEVPGTADRLDELRARLPRR